MDGVVEFYENYQANGFMEVGTPVRVLNPGELRIQDRNNDGQMDIIVDVEPGVVEVVDVGSTFGFQHLPSSGERGVKYAFFDHLGSTKMLVNNQGNVVWPCSGSSQLNELLPFGQEKEVRVDLGETSYNLNFTNKELDRDLELNYFGARYYQPEFPRFLSPDPVRGTPEVPISWNRYLYCRNDPINYFDPDGEDPINFEIGPLELAFDWEYIFYYPSVELVYDDITATIDHGTEGVGDGIGAYAPTVFAGAQLAALAWAGGQCAALAEGTIGTGETLNVVEETTQQISKTRGLERQLAEHVKKLEEYERNPDANDNNGFLKNAPDQETRKKIIEGRIRNLQNQIKNFKRQIEELKKGTDNDGD